MEYTHLLIIKLIESLAKARPFSQVNWVTMSTRLFIVGCVLSSGSIATDGKQRRPHQSVAGGKILIEIAVF